ncbi:hypothetical protein HGP14_04645 [Rhizobium sp. P32RR-XVIII]|uniref:hypothetical protein n=1 Tax=Rhizobium sp. P32RR-XVIII TaxID=2726738 RepID=UPI0014578C1B|nr:hypothetical protein [Rhizobium sp. P32RR-XVIII]NLS02661.1 hypothetical protein [Rhizobium sp. P32RR-XVIII]
MTIIETTTTNDIPLESSSSAVSWGPIIAGALAATVMTLVLMLIGSGLGLTMISPWENDSSSLTTIGTSAAIWLVLVQWISAALGGYLTGRLRTKWAGLHTYEIFFRDTAHGFLAWALATLVVASLLSSAVSSIISTGAQATTSAVGAAGTAGAAAAANADEMTSGFSPSYFTDALLRPADPRTPPANQSNEQVSAEVSRILVSGATSGEIAPDDRTYLDQVVASRTGLSEADAKARVDATLKRIDDAKAAAKEAADTARKTASVAALVGALSLFVGAFCACIAAAIGGRQRDEDEEKLALLKR